MTPHDEATPGRDEAISSPERIRALAHPLRLDLLDHLRNVDQATATECAKRVGESVASCSFHLRMLEKYGFIERGERRGREKPWRVVRQGLELQPVPEQPGSYAAVAQVALLQVLREAERIQQFLHQAHEVEHEWIEASSVNQSSFWATADELRQLGDDVRDLVTRFADRSDPTKRPEGARRAHLFGVINPDPVPAPPTTTAAPDGDPDD